MPAVRNFGLKEVSLNQIELQVGFYPFRGPEASLTLAQAYHTARGVLLRCSLSVQRFARFWESRPGEFHPEALAEPDRTLSRHPAPIMEPRYVPTAREQTTLDSDVRGSRSSA